MSKKTIAWDNFLFSAACSTKLLAAIAVDAAIYDDLAAIAEQYKITLNPELDDLGAQLGRRRDTASPEIQRLCDAIDARHERRLQVQKQLRAVKSHIVTQFGLRRTPPSTTRTWANQTMARTIFWDGSARMDGKKRAPLLEEDGPGPFGDKACRVPTASDQECDVITEQENAAVYGPDGAVEMLVIRNASHAPSALLESVLAVAQEACEDRNNVRPNHPGKMVQFGQNAGQRNMYVNGCRVFGDVCNISVPKRVRFGDELVADKNRRLLGIIGLFWNIVCATTPSDVMDPVHAAIAMAGIPPMHAAGDRDVAGYTLTVDDKEFHFPNALRPPCEAYVSENYAAPIHTDSCYSPFVFTWNVGRQQNMAEYGGGHFVGCDIGVKVHAATDTLIIFRPDRRHGTTQSWGVSQYYLTQTFSTGIKKAYDHALASAHLGADVVYSTRSAFDVDGK